MTQRSRTPGFTLLEVMVAITILALSLSAIFSSEAGAIKMAHRSRKMGVATLLARCKMGEIEEQIAKKGLPAVFDSGSDGCCKDSELDDFKCDWEVDPILLPDTMFAPEDQAKKPGAGGKGPASGPNALMNPGAPGAPPVDMSNPAALGAAVGELSKAGALPGAAPGAQDEKFAAMSSINPTDVLSGGGLGGYASMALSFAYPILKPAFEGQIRRATVTIRWQEGSVKHSFDVTQYIVDDKAVIPALPDAAGQPGANGMVPLPGQVPVAPPAGAMPGI